MFLSIHRLIQTISESTDFKWYQI